MKLFVLGGFSLSFNAGFINSVIIISSLHQAVSHVTGNLARLGVAIERFEIKEMITLTSLILFFFLGAVITGLLVQYERFQADNRYGLVMILEGLLLVVAWLIFDRHAIWSIYIIALACGLQNSMTTHYRGTIVRTTHMTGIITDMGLLIGHFLRRQKIENEKLWLQAGLFSGFLGGCIAGTFSFSRFGVSALLIPALFITTAGIFSFILKHDLEQ